MIDRDAIACLYTTDQYLHQHPDIHEADSPWKISKILPFVDTFARECSKTTVTVLDVGGGAGLILKAVADYLSHAHGKTVVKYCLDLSPAILDRQKATNPDAAKAIVGDIAHTPFVDKEVDLLLMIDVLEHVTDPAQTLHEIARISRYALFKVPLEDTVYYHCMDCLTRGKFRERIIASIGHINIYSLDSLPKQLRDHCGEVMETNITNVYRYLLRTPLSLSNRLFQLAGWMVGRLSPSLAARLFHDYMMVLVACR